MRTTSEKMRMHTYGYRIPEMTIGRLIEDKARKNGDKTFLHFLPTGQDLSYRDVEAESARIAGGLVSLGIAKGDHLAVMMDNCPEQMLLNFAMARIGAVAVPINTSARGKLLSYFLTQSDSVAIFAAEGFAARVMDALDAALTVRKVVLVKSETPLDQVNWSGAERRGVEIGGFDVLRTAERPLAFPEVKFSDLAMLSYTSGTTGPSKASMMVHASVVQYGMTTAESHGYRPDDIVYIPLPINHAAGYLCNLWGAFVADASIALAGRFSASRYWDEIRASGATITNLMGSMTNMLWSKAPDEKDQDNSLRLCLCTPVPKFALDWERRFNTRIVSSYGQSDFVSAAVFTLLDPVSKLGSAGRARSGVELRVVDEDDIDVAPGKVGELLVRTNNPWSMSIGYYKMPEVTANALRNLWWHTGDRVRIDEDGYMFFADRKKDAIRRRGENISAFEVEEIILGHTAVAEAAVYAVSSEMSEDEVGVSIIPKQGHVLDQVELIEFCTKNMAHYMVPRFIHVTDDLPRTDSQKVKKAELRKLAEENRAVLWDREKHGIVMKR